MRVRRKEKYSSPPHKRRARRVYYSGEEDIMGLYVELAEGYARPFSVSRSSQGRDFSAKFSWKTAAPPASIRGKG